MADVYVFHSDLEQLKEQHADLDAQYHIAADLLSQVCKRFKFPYQCQCVLETLRVVAATISNLQKLEADMAIRDEITEKEVHNWHLVVESHVHQLMKELEPWLSSVLPVRINEEMIHRELEVSFLLLSL